MKNAFAEYYQKYVLDLKLERAGLFKAVENRYHSTTVLYPGSFIHITPSFYFPHVVYVDLNEVSLTCFANLNEVQAYVEHYKHYNRWSFIRFLPQDFTQPLPLHENSFDLLFALYAGGISQSCKKYLKAGGFLLSNNHHDDAGLACKDPDYELIAALQAKGENYTIIEEQLERYFEPKSLPGKKRKHQQQQNPWPEYRIKADYYIFKKLSCYNSRSCLMLKSRL